MNTPWWILGVVGGLCLLGMLFEIIVLARALIARRSGRRREDDYSNLSDAQ